MPITSLDEYPVHQIATTVDHVVDSDPRWFERYALLVDVPQAALSIAIGLGVYPNLDAKDAFAVLSGPASSGKVGGAASLGHDRLVTAVGPIHIRVVRGLAHLHVGIDGGAHGFSAQLDLQSELRPLSAIAPAYDGASMFAQVGAASGSVRVGDSDIDVDPATSWYSKTNTWGVAGPDAAQRLRDPSSDVSTDRGPTLIGRGDHGWFVADRDSGTLTRADGTTAAFVVRADGDDAPWPTRAILSFAGGDEVALGIVDGRREVTESPYGCLHHVFNGHPNDLVDSRVTSNADLDGALRPIRAMPVALDWGGRSAVGFVEWRPASATSRIGDDELA